jgi:hypothetical protein
VKDNIKMALGEIGWAGVDWIGLAQDRDKWMALVKMVIYLRILENAGKILNDCSTGSLLSSTPHHRVS